MLRTIIVNNTHLEQALLPLSLIADITITSSDVTGDQPRHLTLSQLNGQSITLKSDTNLISDNETIGTLNALLTSMSVYHAVVDSGGAIRYLTGVGVKPAASQVFNYQTYFLKQMVTSLMDGKLDGYLELSGEHSLLTNSKYDESRSLFNHQSIQWIGSKGFSSWLKKVEQRVEVMATYMASYDELSEDTIALLDTLIDRLNDTRENLLPVETEQDHAPH